MVLGRQSAQCLQASDDDGVVVVQYRQQRRAEFVDVFVLVERVDAEDRRLAAGEFGKPVTQHEAAVLGPAVA